MTRPPVARRAIELSAVFLGQLAFALFATWPLLPNMARTAAFNPGDPLLSAWLFGWGAHAVVHAPLRIFDANIFNPEGLALAFTENMLGMSLPVAPVFWVTDNALLTQNLALVVYIGVAGLGTYLVARELGVSSLLSFVCGTAWALTPYRLSQFGHPHVLGTHWLPFVVLMLVRLSDPDLPAHGARRRVGALASVFALQVWSSLTGAAMAGIMVGAWLLWCAARERRRVLRPLARVSVAMAVATVLILPLAVTYAVVRDRHPDYRHTEAETLDYSASPASYLSPRDGGVVSDGLYRELAERFTTPSEISEKRLFPGAWVVLAALAGTVVLAVQRFRGASGAVFGLVLAATFFVFSLGPRLGARSGATPLPFFALQAAFGGLARVPSRFGIVVPLGLVLVAGVGLARLPRRASTVVAGVSLVLLGAEVAPTTMTFITPPKITAAHRAIAEREGIVLALPMPEYDDRGYIDGQTIGVEARHLYLSTAHFRPLVNGYASYHPRSYFEIVRAVQHFPSERAFAALKSRDVRTVIVQTDLVAATKRWPDVVDRLRAWPGVSEIASGDGVRVFDITGATATAAAVG